MAYITDYETPEVAITLTRFREVFGGKLAASKGASAASILTEAALLSASAPVRFCRHRFSPTGELKYRGARRVRTQVHCISVPLLLL
jgi:hypothetical protein